MPRAQTLFVGLGAALLVLFLGNAAPAQTVWSGFDFEFVRPNDALGVQDLITDNVHIARSVQQGIYNSVTETSFSLTSPAGTLWATDFNNSGETISAENWAVLDFDPWINAYGGQGQAMGPLPGRLTSRNAVLHLVDDDIYLDIQFTSWTSNAGGGGFSYNRAEAPPGPTTTGDYNDNGVVDAADYVVWRQTLTQSASPVGSGADGDESGTIDAGDYDFWRARFGNVVPAAKSGLDLAAVPEPATAASSLFCLAFLLARTYRRQRFTS